MAAPPLPALADAPAPSIVCAATATDQMTALEVTRIQRGMGTR
jgi:hypothetical protein